MSNEDKIQTLIPEFQPLVRNWIAQADHWLSQSQHFKLDIIQITEARRTLEYQAGLYSVGRQWNEGQKTWSLVGTPITHTMNSLHLTGEAFDYALLDTKHNVLSWPTPKISFNKEMYLALGQIAKDLGLWPGAFWTHIEPDWIHIGYRNG